MDCLTRIAIEDTKHDLCDEHPCADCLHAEGYDTQEDVDWSLAQLTFKQSLLDWLKA
jgi:hypothetical protein